MDAQAQSLIDALATSQTSRSQAKSAWTSTVGSDGVASEFGFRTQEQLHLSLLRAVGELAETHAIAADLAAERVAIDLPLDLPDPPAADASAASRIGADVIRACRDRLSAHATAPDRTRLDVVAALFDRILADSRLAVDTRVAMARLQLPVLRMALADESFFDSRTHPTRRLLDRLTAAAIEWNVDSPCGRACLAEVDRVTHAVIRAGSEHADDHAHLLEVFERNLIDIASAGAGPGTLVTDQEDREVFEIKATIQISQLLAGLEVDRAIRYFLLDVWSQVLVELACRPPNPVRDATLARAKRLCIDLAWSATPKTTSADRARLAGLLPTMIVAVRNGLRMIDFPRAGEEVFFAEWTRALQKAVLISAPGEPNRTRYPDPSATERLNIDDFARRLAEGGFNIDATQKVGTTAWPRMGTHAGAPSGSGGASGPSKPAAVAVPATAAPDQAISAPAAGPESLPVPTIASLQKGEWFELRERRGFVRVRLSWISPLKSFYLFIGADSALTRSFDPETLIGLFERGELVRLPR